MADQISWSVSESGDVGVEEYLARLNAQFDDLREPLSRVADYVEGMIQEEFDSEGLRSGGWLPLSAKYAKWKERRDPAARILELDPIWMLLHGGDHGTPERDYMQFSMLDRAAWDIGPHDATFEPDSTRAAWHQEGVDHPRGRGGPLPARPIVEFTEPDYMEIENIFEDWIRDQIIR